MLTGRDTNSHLKITCEHAEHVNGLRDRPHPAPVTHQIPFHRPRGLVVRGIIHIFAASNRCLIGIPLATVDRAIVLEGHVLAEQGGVPDQFGGSCVVVNLRDQAAVVGHRGNGDQ